jgi:hypothetical protein
MRAGDLLGKTENPKIARDEGWNITGIEQTLKKLFLNEESDGNGTDKYQRSILESLQQMKRNNDADYEVKQFQQVKRPVKDRHPVAVQVRRRGGRRLFGMRRHRSPISKETADFNLITRPKPHSLIKRCLSYEIIAQRPQQRATLKNIHDAQPYSRPHDATIQHAVVPLHPQGRLRRVGLSQPANAQAL